MSEDQLPTDFLVNAIIRTAAREGVSIVVQRHGDNGSGTIILKINLLNGLARILTQVRIENDLVWCPASRDDPMQEAEAEIYLAREAEMDPDAWHIEIEDKLGRVWFPGKLIET